MQIHVSRGIMARHGLIATARRIASISFVPPLGAALVEGSLTLIVTALTFDLDSGEITVTDVDDRQLMMVDNVTQPAVQAILEAYEAAGWTIATRWSPAPPHKPSSGA